MSAPVRTLTRIAPPREAPDWFRAYLREHTRRTQELELRLAAMEGHQGTPTVRKDTDHLGNRVTNVGFARHDRDVPPVAQLRTEALYASNGRHETDRLILAKGGIRTVTPAVVDDDVITLGQVKRMFVAAGIELGDASAADSAAAVTFSSVTAMTSGFGFPPLTVTLTNGANGAVAITDAVFLRIIGPTGAYSVGGFAQPADGRWLIVYATVAQQLTILNEDAATTAGLRITTGTGANLVMDGPGITQFLYDTLTSRWVVL